MFPKLSLLATSLMVVSCLVQRGTAATADIMLQTLAVANYPPPPSGTTNQCCKTVGTNTNPVISAVAALIGVDISDIVGDLSVGCTVITVLGNTWCGCRRYSDCRC